MTYRFVCRGRNCASYVSECIESVKKQTLSNWAITAMVDCDCDDYSVSLLESHSNVDSRIRVFAVNPPAGVCHNMWRGIANCGADPEDVVVILDLDDKLLHPKALEVVDNNYRKYPNTLCTYGSFMVSSTSQIGRICRPYPQGAAPRKHKWLASHLKTFKYKLFQHIPREYFMDNGRWGLAASDLALMFSVMEVAGMENCRFIKDPTYYYRYPTNITCNRGTQKKWEKIWRHKKPLIRQY